MAGFLINIEPVSQNKKKRVAQDTEVFVCELKLKQ